MGHVWLANNISGKKILWASFGQTRMQFGPIVTGLSSNIPLAIGILAEMSLPVMVFNLLKAKTLSTQPIPEHSLIMGVH